MLPIKPNPTTASFIVLRDHSNASGLLPGAASLRHSLLICPHRPAVVKLQPAEVAVVQIGEDNPLEQAPQTPMVVFNPVPLLHNFQFMIRTAGAHCGRRQIEPYPPVVVRCVAFAFAALVEGLVERAVPQFPVLPDQLTLAVEAVLRLESQVINLQRDRL